MTRIAIDARKIGDFGIGTYAEGLLRGLAAIGGPEQYAVLVAAKFRDRVPAAFETIVCDAPNYSVREQFSVARLVERAGVDLFHSLHFVLPLGRRPSMVTIHDLIPLHFPYRNPIARNYYRTMLHRAARKSVVMCTVSAFVRDQIRDELGYPAHRIFVTPNGIDPLFFDEIEPERTHGRFFLFAGNDKPHKNVDLLVDAFARVREEETDLTLVLAGAPFERFRERAGIHLAGFVTKPKLAALYRGALAVVVPSSEEGFGLPAAEAMACGAAVITSEAGALVEITGDSAIHVDVRYADALAAAMQRVASDDDLRVSYAAQGRERARNFTWERCALATRAAYRAAS